MSACVLAVGVAPASAQTCFGNVAISAASPLSVGGAFDVASGAKTGTGLVTAGTDMFFVGAAVGRSSYSDFETGQTNFNVTPGAQFALGAGKKVKVCPFVGIGKTSGLQDAFDQDYSSTIIGPGVGLGFVAVESGTRAVVPSVNLQFVRIGRTVKYLNLKDTSSFT